MQDLLAQARRTGERLKSAGATLAVAESSAGGLISAAVLSVPGASAWFLGGAVVYTGQARQALLGLSREAMQGYRGATEPYALLLARTVRERHGATWGLAESGATGPAGNRYGDPAGHAALAIAGPSETTLLVATHSADRAANMRAFAAAALALLDRALDG